MEQKNKQEIITGKNYSQAIWMLGGVLVLLTVSLYLFKMLFGMLLLVLAGVLMAIYFHGCAGLLHRYLKLPGKWSVIVAVLLNFMLLAGFFWFVGARLQEQVAALSDTLPSTISNAKEWLGNYPLGNKLLDYINASADSGKTMSVVKQFFSSSFGILSDAYIILLLGIFFTATPGIYKKGIIRLLPADAKEKGTQVLQKIHTLLKKWIVGQIFGFVFIGVLTGIGLLLIGMPLVLTLAIVAGLMNFIPNFGPIIALIPAVLLALMQGTTTAIIVVCLYTGIQVVQSAVTQPLIQKKMVNVPPGLIIFGQVSMGLLAGFWGVLLATPIIVIVMTLVDKLYLSREVNASG